MRYLFADSLERLRGVEARGEKKMKCVVERVYNFARVAATAHAGDIQTVTARVVAYRKRVGKRVFDYHRVAADVGFAPDAAELVNARISAYVSAVFDKDMARERRGVRHDDLVAYDAIVRDVRLCHQETIIAYLREHPSAFRASMNGDEFAYAIAPPDSGLRRLAPVLQVLRGKTYGDEGKDVRVVANGGAPVHDRVRFETHALA
jgi:hypothetical protein